MPRISRGLGKDLVSMVKEAPTPHAKMSAVMSMLGYSSRQIDEMNPRPPPSQDNVGHSQDMGAAQHATKMSAAADNSAHAPAGGDANKLGASRETMAPTTGPRGGVYHVSRSGEKVYEKK